jgi:hypothetical protein
MDVTSPPISRRGLGPTENKKYRLHLARSWYVVGKIQLSANAWGASPRNHPTVLQWTPGEAIHMEAEGTVTDRR